MRIFGVLVTDLFLGPAFLLILVGAGLFLSVRLRFLQIRCFPRAVRETLGGIFRKKPSSGGVSSFQAASTVLAGTLGTGNIIGVASALLSGGPGSILWMCLSSVVCMALKYAENFLAVRYRVKGEDGRWTGGPMFYLERGIQSRKLALLFAGVCVCASFGVGNLAQSNAAAGALREAFSVPPFFSGVCLFLLSALGVTGGLKRVTGMMEKAVPFLSGAFLAACFGALILNAGRLPAAAKLIFQSAFCLPAASGGILGFLLSRSVRFGIARGAFSNEAGMGSGAIIHGSAETDSPLLEGFWGILEVFLDTTFMCTVTALVILTSDGWGEIRESTALTASAFSSVFGDFAGRFVSLCVFLFAAASIPAWYCCGEKALRFLTKKERALRVYQLGYLSCCLIGACAPMDAVWNLCDFLNLLMACPNVWGLLLLSGEVSRETKSLLSNGPAKAGKDPRASGGTGFREENVL